MGCYVLTLDICGREETLFIAMLAVSKFRNLGISDVSYNVWDFNLKCCNFLQLGLLNSCKPTLKTLILKYGHNTEYRGYAEGVES